MTVGPADQAPGSIRGVLFDLLMAVMNSLEVWKSAAGDPRHGLAWRDNVMARMAAAGTYAPYENLVGVAAAEIGLPAVATQELFERWASIKAWPDAGAIAGLSLPYGFVTNCSAALSGVTAWRSGLRPRFTLSAEEAGCYKPAAEIYREACRRLGTPLHQTAFVAGSPYDAAGAQAVGLPTWLVVRRADHLDAPHPVWVANSLHDVVAEIRQAYSER